MSTRSKRQIKFFYFFSTHTNDILILSAWGIAATCTVCQPGNHKGNTCNLCHNLQHKYSLYGEQLWAAARPRYKLSDTHAHCFMAGRPWVGKRRFEMATEGGASREEEYAGDGRGNQGKQFYGTLW